MRVGKCVSCQSFFDISNEVLFVVPGLFQFPSHAFPFDPSFLGVLPFGGSSHGGPSVGAEGSRFCRSAQIAKAMEVVGFTPPASAGQNFTGGFLFRQEGGRGWVLKLGHEQEGGQREDVVDP